MEPIGTLASEVAEANSLKNMVGPCGLEPQTSTASSDLARFVGERPTSRLYFEN
jgi:hypothetical protein